MNQNRMFLWIAMILSLGFMTSACIVPESGVTRCYDNEREISCPAPGEPFYGQDGNYTINPMFYTKLDAAGEGLPESAVSWEMVRDTVTGLIWEVKTETSKNVRYTWEEANAYASNLTIGEFSDWRVPTIQELAFLINSGIPLPDPGIDTRFFPNTMQDGYWSSSSDASDADRAWFVNFYDDSEYRAGKASRYYVRAVRGGEPWASDRFTDNNNGTVSDNSSRLMWQKSHIPAKNWEEALAYCEALNLAGYSDWRLPNIKELLSILDYSRFDPAINITYFPDTISSWYWSSSTHVTRTNQAWSVYLGSGMPNDNNKMEEYYVRAVRSGGFLNVGIDPFEAQEDGARWRRVGTDTWRHGGREDNAPAGSHIVEFKEIVGWLKPANREVNVEEGRYVSITGFYIRENSGSLQVIIEPEAAETDGALWRRTGTERWRYSGNPENNILAGSYTVEFNDVAGWIKPDNLTVTVAVDETTTVTGTYVRETGFLTGAIRVIIEPAEARTAGAQWRRTGTSTWRSSGSAEDNVPEGNHPIEFREIDGWNTPAGLTVMVTANETSTATGNYTRIPQTGALQVNIQPQEAITAGAQWRRTGTAAWHNSGHTETGIATGSHTVEFREIAGWVTPGHQTVAISENSTVTIWGEYSLSAGQAAYIIATFPYTGIQYYSLEDGTWRDMYSLYPYAIAAGDLDGDGIDDLIGAWQRVGVFAFLSDSQKWSNITPYQPDSIAAGDMTGNGRTDLIGSWRDFGLYYRDSATGGWPRLVNIAPEAMAVGDVTGDGQRELVGSWPGYGIYARDISNAWTPVSRFAPPVLGLGDVTGNNRADYLGSWPEFGLYYLDSTTDGWEKLSQWHASILTSADLTGDGRDEIVAVFENGIWIYYPAAHRWEKISTEQPDAITTGRLNFENEPF